MVSPNRLKIMAKNGWIGKGNFFLVPSSSIFLYSIDEILSAQQVHNNRTGTQSFT